MTRTLRARSLPWKRLVLAFGLVNACLYACFLPLWEGFDEPFHYAYVQSLATRHLPVFGKAKVSQEIVSSFQNVPLSRFLSGPTGMLSFEEWWILPASERLARISRWVDPALRYQESNLNNYEAQQAPLAYMLLVPFDLALSQVQLRYRILALRLLAAVTSALLLFFAISKFDGTDARFLWSAMACVFCSQMLWATVAHIGNDYLAVPLTVFFLVLLGSRRAFLLAIVLGLGLLTKAYFLAFTPVFIAFVFIRRRWLTVFIPLLIAGPWYWRNYLLYGSLSGTQQSVTGISFRQALSALPKIPWPASIVAFLHWSLWTGNWSFLSFSQATLNLELILAGIE